MTERTDTADHDEHECAMKLYARALEKNAAVLAAKNALGVFNDALAELRRLGLTYSLHG